MYVSIFTCRYISSPGKGIILSQDKSGHLS